jgi:FtsP/CotA-like multicopper oxidase with cupredoxin domain
MAVNGVAVANPTLQDTVQVPFYSGKGPYPSVTVRMDFRDPNIAGTFVYHCHVLFHEDNGMMAKIRVDP